MPTFKYVLLASYLTFALGLRLPPPTETGVEFDDDATFTSMSFSPPHPKSAAFSKLYAEPYNVSAANVPRNGHIAVLLHGEIFRQNRVKYNGVCNEGMKKCQYKSAESLYKNVVKPLLSLNNKVDLFMVTKPCDKLQELVNKYKEYGIESVTAEERPAKGQTEGVFQTLDLFHTKISGDFRKYDTMMLTRPDTVFNKPLIESPVFDFKKVNWANPCEYTRSSPSHTMWGEKCGNDILITMPGHMVQDFEKSNCFNTWNGVWVNPMGKKQGGDYGGNGHRSECMQNQTKAAGLQQGWVFWDIPAGNVRAGNNWYSLCS
jgi:hypothetical protein